MNKEQYETLTRIEPEPEKILNIDDLQNKSDRTLLYGYTCDRDIWHVYIKDNKIHAIIIVSNFNSYNEKILELNVKDNKRYVPNKRLYPETCDFEFCALLKSKGIDLPFTTWQDRPEQKKYYGKIL